jgi:hypothetical protein
MYRVSIDGIEINCDSADEALQLVGHARGHATMGNGSRSDQVANTQVNGSRWTSTRFQNFDGLLNDTERRVLQELIENPDGIPDATLRQALGLSSNRSFGPIFTGLSRKAKRVGVSFEDVLSSATVRLSNGQTVREFKAVAPFLRVASDSGGLK